MTDSPLYGAYMKLKRAQLHLDSLYRSIKDFIDSDPYEVFDESIPPAQPLYEESMIVRVKQKHAPRREEWGAIVGDVVHNLRSALDHLVWELSKSFQGGEPPPPIPREWKRIGFPIYEREDADSLAQLGAMLWAVNPDLKAGFEWLQPYTISEPKTHPLSILHDLWNVDKHRHVHLAVISVVPHSMGYIAAGKGHVEMTKGSEPELEDKAELFRVHRWQIPPELPGMYMQTGGHLEVRFGSDSPGAGLRVVEALDRLYGLVFSILVGFGEQFL